MSPRAARLCLWILLLLAAPLPYWAVEPGRQPVSHLALFAGATGAAVIAEPSGIAAIIAGLFLSQTVLYTGLLYLLARVVVHRLPTPRARLIAVVLTAAALAVVALLPLYVTPFSTTGARGNIFSL